MLKEIPDHWKHDKSMDMLWLFYQITDELLSETTSDTYALPLHNAITLLDEMDEVYPKNLFTENHSVNICSNS